MKTAPLLVGRLWETLGSDDPKVIKQLPHYRTKSKTVELVAKKVDPFKNFGESSKKSDKLEKIAH